MGIKRCLACGDTFRSRPQVPDQSYCSTLECQRERRKVWQRERRRSDNDYRDNQARAQKKWLLSHPAYWKRYRATHPEYAENNRAQQRTRNAARAAGLIAKSDASMPISPLVSGTYRLSPAQAEEIAKMDAWIVRITLLSGT